MLCALRIVMMLSVLLVIKRLVDILNWPESLFIENWLLVSGFIVKFGTLNSIFAKLCLSQQISQNLYKFQNFKNYRFFKKAYFIVLVGHLSNHPSEYVDFWHTLCVKQHNLQDDSVERGQTPRGDYLAHTIKRKLCVGALSEHPLRYRVLKRNLTRNILQSKKYLQLQLQKP